MDSVFIKNGVYLGVSKIVIFLIGKFFNFDNTFSVFSLIFDLFAHFYFMYRAIEEVKSMNRGNVSFEEGFKASWLTLALGMTMYDLFVHVIYSFFTKLEFTEFFYGFVKVLFSMPGNFIGGAVLAAIISAIMKKEGIRFKL